ncbi:MAG TPA: hypothetical protein VNJ29_01440 [Candidatus Nitrosotenuis sp.]|nr:hypothetical protein [Candidatus Nitrosotenuis sp.]
MMIALVSISCGYATEIQAPESFPDTEIIFTASYGIGFVNADGTDTEIIDFAVKLDGVRVPSQLVTIAKPAITRDNLKIVAMINNNHGYWYMDGPDLLIVWQVNEQPIPCSQWGSQNKPLLAVEENHIFIETDNGMALYNIDDCGTDAQPIKTYKNEIGVFSPNLQFIASVITDTLDLQKKTIVIKERESKREIAMFEGDFPAWSLNSKYLAYTGKDGIYVLDVTSKTQPIQVSGYINPAGAIHPTYQLINDTPPPEPAWSPDGKWLVYHRLIREVKGMSLPDYYAIYKLNIETGEEIKIVDGGMYPYWKWPAVSTP